MYSEKSQGIGIVKKETLPTYRMAMVEKCQKDQTFDPKFQATMDNLWQKEINKACMTSRP